MVDIKARRISLGLTQRDIAEAVGVSEASVSKWESGHIDNMKRDKIAKLASVLHVSPVDFIDHESIPAVEIPVSNSGNVGSLIVFRSGSMDAKSIEAVKAFIEQMGGELV